MIDIALDAEAVMAGHFVSGAVRWSGDAVRRIVVAAEWKASAFNGSRRGVGRAMAHASRGEREGQFPLHLLIPHEGPVSFAGEIVTIEWALWVHLEGSDEYASSPFRVIPRRAT